MRHTKRARIYRKNSPLLMVQSLPDHTNIDSTVRDLGVKLEDALAIAAALEI